MNYYRNLIITFPEISFGFMFETSNIIFDDSINIYQQNSIIDLSIIIFITDFSSVDLFREFIIRLGLQNIKKIKITTNEPSKNNNSVKNIIEKLDNILNSRNESQSKPDIEIEKFIEDLSLNHDSVVGNHLEKVKDLIFNMFVKLKFLLGTLINLESLVLESHYNTFLLNDYDSPKLKNLEINDFNEKLNKYIFGINVNKYNFEDLYIEKFNFRCINLIKSIVTFNSNFVYKNIEINTILFKSSEKIILRNLNCLTFKTNYYNIFFENVNIIENLLIKADMLITTIKTIQSFFNTEMVKIHNNIKNCFIHITYLNNENDKLTSILSNHFSVHPLVNLEILYIIFDDDDDDLTPKYTFDFSNYKSLKSIYMKNIISSIYIPKDQIQNFESITGVELISNT